MEIDSPKSDLFSVPTLLMQLVSHAPKIFGSANKHFLDKIPQCHGQQKAIVSLLMSKMSHRLHTVMYFLGVLHVKRKDECQTKTKQSSCIKQIAFRIKAFLPRATAFHTHSDCIR